MEGSVHAVHGRLIAVTTGDIQRCSASPHGRSHKAAKDRAIFVKLSESRKRG
jgi:hypothetical protein